jgi:hypothetical protein
MRVSGRPQACRAVASACREAAFACRAAACAFRRVAFAFRDAAWAFRGVAFACRDPANAFREARLLLPRGAADPHGPFYGCAVELPLVSLVAVTRARDQVMTRQGFLTAADGAVTRHGRGCDL